MIGALTPPPGTRSKAEYDTSTQPPQPKPKSSIGQDERRQRATKANVDATKYTQNDRSSDRQSSALDAGGLDVSRDINRLQRVDDRSGFGWVMVGHTASQDLDRLGASTEMSPNAAAWGAYRMAWSIGCTKSSAGEPARSRRRTVVHCAL
jgi:hypothetical protein